MSVRRFEKFDFSAGDLARPETTADGYWKLEGKVARTGIQIYSDGKGNVIRELRLEGDVKKSLDGFALIPLTNGHPPGLVDPTNAKQYVAGAVGAAEYADGWVKAPITVWTKDAIDAIRDGRAQLSVGYQCALVMEPGEWQGQKYDARQTEITVNHVALVDAARAGPEARLRLDAGDAATADFFTSQNTVLGSEPTTRIAHQERTPMAYKIKVDGLELEVADANAGAIIERAIVSAKKDGEDKTAAEKLRADAAELAKTAAEKSLVEAKAKLDSLEAAAKVDVKCDECDGSGKVFGKECEGCAGKGEMKADALLDLPRRKASRARSDARAAAVQGAARAKLLQLVAPHLSANEKLDEKSDVEIKRLTLDKLNIKFEDKSDAYVNVRFDVEMDKIKAATPSAIEAARATVIDGVIPPKVEQGGKKVPCLDTIEDVRDYMKQNLLSANVKAKK